MIDHRNKRVLLMIFAGVCLGILAGRVMHNYRAHNQAVEDQKQTNQSIEALKQQVESMQELHEKLHPSDVSNDEKP